MCCKRFPAGRSIDNRESIEVEVEQIFFHKNAFPRFFGEVPDLRLLAANCGPNR